MFEKSITQACDLVLFGAKGDLVRRKLLPSLYQLEKAGALHPKTRIISVGRVDWSIKDYNHNVRESLESFMNEPIEEVLWKSFMARLDFCNLDVNDTKNFIKLKNKINQEKRVTVNYFAMPPTTFEMICKGLGEANLNREPTRVIIEKPIGTDLISSKIINDQVAKYFKEKQIYRIDHYLGKETVLNLLALRFSNAMFFSNWSHSTVDHVQITIAEEVGIEGRWNYFDHTGQMRDMIQSHLLQILTIISMSPPLNLSANCIRDEKVKILRSLRFINKTNVNKTMICGQYTSGLIKGIKVPGYLEEKGANKNSRTETFVAIRVNIDNWRWIGVPFYLRTGKRLPNKCSEIVIYFKKPAINLFKHCYKKLPNNKLTIRLQPNEGIDIEMLNKVPGLNYKYNLQNTILDVNFKKTFKQKRLTDAYERLLLEAMCGMQSLFVRHDEIEEAWRWVDIAMNAWKRENDFPELYEAGNVGPISSSEMIKKDGRMWNDLK